MTQANTLIGRSPSSLEEELARLTQELRRLRAERDALRQTSRDQRRALQQRNRYIRLLQMELEGLAPTHDTVLLRAASGVHR
jgi:chromosome segregation ATPase